MKTIYKISDGKLAEIEVNSAVAELLANFEREDENAARKERWRKEVSIEAMHEKTGFELADTTVDIEGDFIANEEKETVITAIARLSDKQRRLVRLRYYEEKSEYEIAAILGINQSNVHRQLETIHNALKNILKNFYN